MNNWRYNGKRYLLIIAGSASLMLGLVGLAVPVLPTTPFLLLASFCYLRSSSKLYHWLIGHKVFGPFIYNYMTYRAVLRKTKIVAMIFLWVSLLISIALVNHLPVRLLLLVVGLAVSIHLAALKTLTHKHHDGVCEKSDGIEEKDHHH